MTNSDDDDRTSNLHVLAEVATLFYEELQKAKKGKSKIVCDEVDNDEEEKKSFFDLIPRKVRSSLKKSDCNGASTSTSSSSSLLLDLNKTNPFPLPSSLTFKKRKNPRNPLRSEPSSSMFESEKMEMKNPRNPRRPKPSSSRWFADYDMEMENPPNPSSQSSLSSFVTEHNSRKRRRASEEKKPSSYKLKKAKVVHLSWKGRDMIPQSLVTIMRGMNVFEKPKLIFEKSLFATDIDPGESRLSMPKSQIINEEDFLTPEEVRILKEDINNVKKLGFGAILVDQRGEKWGMFLKRWGNEGKWIYSLTCGWNEAVAANGFKEDDGISVWTFRLRGILCFALVPPPQKGESSSSLASQ